MCEQIYAQNINKRAARQLGEAAVHTIAAVKGSTPLDLLMLPVLVDTLVSPHLLCKTYHFGHDATCAFFMFHFKAFFNPTFRFSLLDLTGIFVPFSLELILSFCVHFR